MGRLDALQMIYYLVGYQSETYRILVNDLLTILDVMMGHNFTKEIQKEAAAVMDDNLGHDDYSILSDPGFCVLVFIRATREMKIPIIVDPNIQGYPAWLKIRDRFTSLIMR